MKVYLQVFDLLHRALLHATRKNPSGLVSVYCMYAADIKANVIDAGSRMGWKHRCLLGQKREEGRASEAEPLSSYLRPRPG